MSDLKFRTQLRGATLGNAVVIVGDLRIGWRLPELRARGAVEFHYILPRCYSQRAWIGADSLKAAATKGGGSSFACFGWLKPAATSGRYILPNCSGWRGWIGADSLKAGATRGGSARFACLAGILFFDDFFEAGDLLLH